MFHKKTKKELVSVTVESWTTCDKCGERIHEELYDAFESSFEYKTGKSYPSGGDTKTFGIDMCKPCGLEAMELLKKNGFKGTTTESDW